jgi:hypothetical protein
MKDAVAQNAGIVDDRIDAAERVDSSLDDVLGGLGIGDALEVRDGFAAGLGDDLDNLLGRGLAGAALAVGGG